MPLTPMCVNSSKRRQKRAILDALSADAQELVDQFGNGIGNSLAAPLNNARLVSLNLYEGRLVAFKAILRDCDEELDCFYSRADALAKLPDTERSQALNALAD